MADQEQLEILKQGSEVWNQWREENNQVPIDLSQVHLRAARLSGVNLREADLNGAHLGEAILEDANLMEAKLKNVNLEGANLRRVRLYKAALEEAKLFQADFSEAALDEAILWKADLREARLQGAHLDRANLMEADLTGAHLEGAILPETLCHHAKFPGARLEKANLQDAKLFQVDLRDAILTGAALSGADLLQADLSGADLRGASLMHARLGGANLDGADLRGAFLLGADLSEANLKDANLERASLGRANLTRADLSRANLTRAYLDQAQFVETQVDQARISGSYIYGINVWDLKGEFEAQKDLVITLADQPVITVDNVKVAQFIYLILNNERIRDVINTITSKSVLILGRFGPPERKAVLDELRNKLREYNLLPIVFDFERPDNRDYTETVQTLAGLSLFVIVDVTNPKSVPMEMEATVKQFKIPYVPIIDLSVDNKPYSMMADLQNNFHWVLGTYGYSSKEELLENIDTVIIERALAKHKELSEQKATTPQVFTLDKLKKGKQGTGSDSRQPG